LILRIAKLISFVEILNLIIMRKTVYFFAFIFILTGSVVFMSSCNKDKDTTPPVITILGDNPANVCQSDTLEYVDPGASAYDEVDGDVTSSVVVVENTVNIAVVGQYSVKYRANDKSGNFIEAQRIVNVIYCK